MLYYIFIVYTTLFIVGVQGVPYYGGEAKCWFYNLKTLNGGNGKPSGNPRYYVERRILGDELIIKCECTKVKSSYTLVDALFVLGNTNHQTLTTLPGNDELERTTDGDAIKKTLTVESTDLRYHCGNEYEWTYMCCAKSDKGYCKDGTQLFLQMLGLSEDTIISTKPIEQNKDLVFECKIGLYVDYYRNDIEFIYRIPPTNTVFYKWTLNEQTLESNEKFSITVSSYNGSTLTIKNPTLQDKGEYHCHIYMEEDNDLTTADRKPKKFSVAVPPFPTTETHNDKTYGSVNVNKILECELDGSPEPTITWYKDGKKIGNGTLTFTPFQESDVGTYMCSGENEYGRLNLSYSLQAESAPVLDDTHTSSSETIGGLLGSNRTLKCPISGFPLPTVTWRKGSVELPGDDNRFRTGSYNGIENGALYITHIVQSDAGHYVCVGSNRLGDFTFDTTLNILVPPFLSTETHTNKAYASLKENLAVECDIDGSPEPNITWYKDNAVFGYGILTFSPFRKSDEGTYTCQAVNEFGSLNLSYSFIGKFGPELEDPNRSNSETIGVRLGLNRTWNCPIVGVPLPKVKWYKGSVELPGDDKRFRTGSYNGMENGALYLTHIVQLDAGNYTCVGTNDIDSHTVTFSRTLQVLVEPFLTSKTNSTQKVYNSGEYGTFACPVDGFPKPNVTWYKNPYDSQNDKYTGVIVQLHADNNRIFIQHIDGIVGGLLNFTNFTLVDSGKYYCEAANGVPPNATYELGLREKSLIVYPDFKRKMPQGLFGVYAIGVTAYTIISIWAANYFYNRRYPPGGAARDNDGQGEYEFE